MKISAAIEQLKIAMSQYGDLTIYTWDGEITSLGPSPALDGLDMVSTPHGSKPNEITLEIRTKDETS